MIAMASAAHEMSSVRAQAARASRSTTQIGAATSGSTICSAGRCASITRLVLFVDFVFLDGSVGFFYADDECQAECNCRHADHYGGQDEDVGVGGWNRPRSIGR